MGKGGQNQLVLCKMISAACPIEQERSLMGPLGKGEQTVGADLALLMGREAWRSGCFPGDCSSSRVQRGGLQSHGRKHQLRLRV